MKACNIPHGQELKGAVRFVEDGQGEHSGIVMD